MKETKRNLRGVPTRLAALFMCVLCLTTVIPLTAAADDEVFSSAESVSLTDEQSTDEESEAESDFVSDEESSSEESESSEVGEVSETSEESSEISQPESSGESSESSEESEPVSEAEALYNRLIAITSAEEMKSALENMTDEEVELVEEFTDEQTEALEAKMNELGMYDTVETASSYSVEQGKSQSVSKSGYIDSVTLRSCTPSESGITVSGSSDGYTINVASSVATGTYTLTVGYYTYSWYGSQYNTDTITLTVTEGKPESAQIFYLKTPTSDPDSNDTSEWCDYSIGNGTVLTNGATWVSGKNIFNPGQYVQGMTSGMVKQDDGSWLMPKSSYASDYKSIYKAYKTQLEKELGVTLTEDDIEEIYLTPYKISKNNGTNPDKHIDCKISVKTSKVYAAVFWVTLPDGTQKQVDAKNYKMSDTIAKTSNAPTGTSGSYPETMTVDGETYNFDGWYNEAGDKVAEWNYTPNNTELADGTVNFYAHYTKAIKTYSLTVTKDLSGNGYDNNEKFTFTVSYDGVTKTFELGDNGKSTVTEIPVGAVVSITEDPKSYTLSTIDYSNNTPEIVSYLITKASDIKDGSKLVGFTFPMPEGDVNIGFTNSKNIPIDTGISLTTAPYVLIIVFVGAGLAVYFVKRRRRED